MKKFISNIVFFLVPVILFCIGIELFIVFKTNSFNTKANFIQKNTNVEVLFLGSSHTQNAVNPEFMSRKTANLAYGGQDYKLDSAVFFRYVSELKNLKYVFLEVDYHSLDRENESYYFKNSWYYKYHNIQDLHLKKFERYSLFLSSPAFFKDYIIRSLNPKAYHYEINEFGFVVNDFPGIFQDLNHDADKINASAKLRLKKRHKENSIETYTKNKSRLIAMINYCKAHQISVVLFKSPVYQSYRDNYIKSKNQRRLDLIDSLLLTNTVSLIDFENSTNFTVDDFKNDDHLNSLGAQKLTQLLDQKLTSLNSKK